MAAEAFDGEVGCRKIRIGRNGTDLIIHSEYTNTNNEKDNINSNSVRVQIYISELECYYLYCWLAFSVSGFSCFSRDAVCVCSCLERGDSGWGLTNEYRHMLQYWAPSWFSYPQDGHFILSPFYKKGWRRKTSKP